MGRDGLEGRLKTLEERAASEGASPLDGFPDWPLDDQIEDVRHALLVHRSGGTRQVATDRQIHVMGLFCALVALAEVGAEEGEHVFPSGTSVTVTVTPDGEHYDIGASALVRVEDLPEGVGEYWERMDPERQPERERWLYENREEIAERSRLARESIAWHEEHGWDKARPEHLLPGEGDR